MLGKIEPAQGEIQSTISDFDVECHWTTNVIILYIDIFNCLKNHMNFFKKIVRWIRH